MSKNKRIYFGMITHINQSGVGWIAYNTAGPIRGERYKDLEAFFSLKSSIVPGNGHKDWVTKNCPVFFTLKPSKNRKGIYAANFAANVTNAFGSGE